MRQVKQLHEDGDVGGFGAFAGELEGLFLNQLLAIGPAEYDLINGVVSKHIAKSGTISDFLGDAADAIEQNRFVRGNSHQHAHGFTKLALYRSTTSSFSVRLHIWWSGIRAFDDSPHEHRWAFYSRLLSGSLRIRNFMEQPPGVSVREETESWHRYRYADASADGKKDVSPDGAAELFVASEYTMLAGSSHTLAPTEPHQVFGRDGAVAATLVITAPPARGYSNVYHRQPSPAASYSFAEQRLDHIQVANVIRRYCASLDPDGLST
jgi:hypothetical protein